MSLVHYVSRAEGRTLGERKKDLDRTYEVTFPWRGCLFLSLIYNTVTLLLLKTNPWPRADKGQMTKQARHQDLPEQSATLADFQKENFNLSASTNTPTCMSNSQTSGTRSLKMWSHKWPLRCVQRNNQKIMNSDLLVKSFKTSQIGSRKEICYHLGGGPHLDGNKYCT